MEQHEWDFYNALYECVKVDLKNETERLKGDEKAFKDWHKLQCRLRKILTYEL